MVKHHSRGTSVLEISPPEKLSTSSTLPFVEDFLYIYIYYRYTCRNEDFPLTILWRFPTSSTSLSSEMWAVRFPNRRKTVVSQVFRARSVPTAPISVKPTDTVWCGETFSFLESLEVTDHLSHFDPCCCW